MENLCFSPLEELEVVLEGPYLLEVVLERSVISSALPVFDVDVAMASWRPCLRPPQSRVLLVSSVWGLGFLVDSQVTCPENLDQIRKKDAERPEKHPELKEEPEQLCRRQWCTW